MTEAVGATNAAAEEAGCAPLWAMLPVGGNTASDNRPTQAKKEIRNGKNEKHLWRIGSEAYENMRGRLENTGTRSPSPPPLPFLWQSQ